MIRFVLIVSLLAGCRISLEDSAENIGPGDRRCKVDMTTTACVGAVGHSDFKWLQTNVFTPNCALAAGCHNGGNDTAGRTDLREGQAYAHLVNFSSALEPSRKLVIPGDKFQSYLMLMVGDFPPGDADPAGTAPAGGYMPKGVSGGLCCQKLDVLEQWVADGAQND
jgi:hypothetical protein